MEAHEDATEAQKTSAGNLGDDARNALTDIVSASAAANVATTPAQANRAVGDARTALGNLITAESAVASILSAVNAVADLRRQQEQDERALTNNSSLIKHLRDNKLLADAVRDAITADSIVVGAAGNSGPSSVNPRVVCAEPCAEFPADIGSGANRVTGQRTVRMQGLVSSSTTPSLSGTGRLSHGFDMKNDEGTTFVNAYTDIARERRTRNSAVNEDDSATLHDERYNYNPDTDYLLAGIWLTVVPDNLGNSTITAFAYGANPHPTPLKTFAAVMKVVVNPAPEQHP